MGWGRTGAVVVGVVLALGGCGARQVGGAGGGRTPSAVGEVVCPGETAAPVATAASTGAAVPPTDHYAENHGFMVPFPLHGQQRCDGLADVAKVKAVLEPIRARGDFDPASAQSALSTLGFTSVRTYQNGPTGVGFVIDAAPLCVDGDMNRAETYAYAFGGYPDHPGCEQPSGGH